MKNRGLAQALRWWVVSGEASVSSTETLNAFVGDTAGTPHPSSAVFSLLL